MSSRLVDAGHGFRLFPPTRLHSLPCARHGSSLSKLKERYDFELLRREQLTSALALPVAVLSALGGALIAMTRSFSYQSGALNNIFGFIVTMDVVAFAICLFDLARVYHRQTYSYLPLLGDMEQSRQEFMSFAESLAGGEAEVLHEFDNELRRRIIAAADKNTRNNDDRSGLLYWARVALFAVLTLTAAAGVPYVIDQVKF